MEKTAKEIIEQQAQEIERLNHILFSSNPAPWQQEAVRRITELEAQLKDAIDLAYRAINCADYTHISTIREIQKDLLALPKALESFPKEQPEQKEFICDECKFTRAPHEHRCLDPENCKCEHCNEVKRFAQTVNKQQPEAQQQFEMKFGRHFMCILTITSNNIVVNSCVNGWGDVIHVDEVSITRK